MRMRFMGAPALAVLQQVDDRDRCSQHAQPTHRACGRQ